MIDGLRTQRAARRRSAASRRSTATRSPRILVGLGRLGASSGPTCASVDLNPLIVRDGRPVAVDALVVLDAAPRRAAAPRTRARSRRRSASASAPLFHPRGVIVAGVSSHPGEVRLRRLPQPAALRLPRRGLRREPRRRRGARAADAARRRRGARRAPPTWSSSARRPAANAGVLRTCAARGVRAAFVASGGYGEAGADGKALEAELVAVAERVRHPARRAERPGPRLDRRRPVRADRRALPAAGTHLGGEPERQPAARRSSTTRC